MGLSNNGRDYVATSVGDPISVASTATGSSATSITVSGAPFTASSGGPPATPGTGHVGHVVASGTTTAVNTYGVILSSSTTVLTVDQWHTPATPETAATTPATTAPLIVLPGTAP